MSRSTSIDDLRRRAAGMLEIPANEQCIGHFQVAVHGLITDMLEHIEKIEKLVGIERA